MPVYMATSAVFDGVDSIPYFWPIVKSLPWLGILYLIKWFCSGVTNPSERKMHGKVVLVTGGTSGVGEAVVRGLASRGAQIVLLTQHSLGDPFLVEYIDDMRKETGNHLITAEQVDLASLHSIRTFATRWIDNAPPRRLDMIVLCANTTTTNSGKVQSTAEGVEANWQINYLANFHLMSILSPALRAQPPDRDVRVIFGSCSSYMGGDLLHITQPETPQASKKKTTVKEKKEQGIHEPTRFSPGNAYATSKYALTTFALTFQKHLSSHKRPDGFPMNTKVFLVDPGLCRTPGTRRWLTWGSLFGLLFYLLTYPFWWLILKSPEMGAQSFLYAAMEERYSRGEGGWLIKECKEREFLRKDVTEENTQKKLWEYSEQMIQTAETRGAETRAAAKRKSEEDKDEADAIKELKDYKEKVGKKDVRGKSSASKGRKA